MGEGKDLNGEEIPHHEEMGWQGLRETTLGK